MTQKPDASEHAPYYSRYIDLVPAGDILTTLEAQLEETLALLAPLTDADAAHRYAPGKWSVAELICHVSDTERIFAYRALRIARGDRTPIEGFEQDPYVTNSPAGRMRLADLTGELASVRRASLSLLRYLNEEEWLRRGVANQKEVSVRAIAWTMAGHEIHHRNVLQERYLTR
jgi:uncharacterized damage-inducible protein DinB